MKKLVIILSILMLFFCGCNSSDTEGKLNLRLKWAYQAQFGGYLVAKEKGFYKELGLDVNIQPGSSDLKPYNTVANESDDVGIGIISQIITSRSNGVPLVAISQLFQDSPNRFVIKSQNRIDSLQQLKGKKVGLWLGGDEIEFASMLRKVGMRMSDVTVIPQKFSITPFLNDEYECSQVMVYNELIQIQNKGLDGSKLQIISPSEYNSAILGDLIFTRDSYLQEHPDRLQKFLVATFKGWKYVIDHPKEAIDIILKYNPGLNRDEQDLQLKAIISLINIDNIKSHGLGYIPVEHYQNAQRILLNGMDSSTNEFSRVQKLDLKTVFTSAVWDRLSNEQKLLK